MPEPSSFWDARFGEPAPAYGDAPNDFLASVAGRLPLRGRVLCVAEGQGRNTVFLAGLGHRVTAVDVSPVGLARAQALAGERGVEIKTVVADLADYEITPGAWDAVVSVFAHLPPDARARLHRGVVVGLAPGGAFVLEAYTPAQTLRPTGGPRPHDVDITMTAAALRDELAGLRVETLREVEREVREGVYHTGAACVVQMLAWQGAA